MNYKFYLKGLLSLLFIAITLSCSKDDLHRLDMPNDGTIQVAKGEIANLNISGLFDENDTRSFSLEEVNKIPQIKLETKEYPITLYIKQLGVNAITKIDTIAKCTVDPIAKTRIISVVVNKFQLQGSGQSFQKNADDWYICGVIGSAPQNFAEQKVFAPITEERKIPIGFPWSKLKIENDGQGVNLGLSFNMIGTLLRLGLRNNIISAVEVNSIKLKSSKFAFTGSFDPTKVTDKDLTDGNYMSFKSDSENKDFDIDARIQNKLLRIESGKEYMYNSAFIWGYPISSDASIQSQMQVLTRPKGMTQQEFESSNLPESEKKTFFRYSVSSSLNAPNGGFKHSKIHKAPFMVTSDLMITEEYHFNKANLNLSIIELHNPTLDDIELKHYGLMKVGLDLTQSPNGVAFFPQNDQTTAERWVDTSNKTGGYKEARKTQALIMPLDLRNGDEENLDWAYWRWRTFEPNLRDGSDPNKTKYYAHSLKYKVIKTGAHSGDNVNDVTFAEPPKDPILKAGKTILILGPGYIEYTPDKDGYGILYPTEPLNAGGAIQKGQLGPGMQPLESYRKGYCQYVFAMANYSTTKSNSRNDNASTNHLAENQGVVLVKQRKDGGLVRKIIDTSFPYNNQGSSAGQLQGKLPAGGVNTHSRVRCDGDYFPSKNFDLNNWHIEDISWSNDQRSQWATREYNTARATLGTRWFVQDGSKANQNNWGENYVVPTKSWK